MEEEKYKCELCSREFNSKEALEMHNKAKHSESIKEEKKTETSTKKSKKWMVWAFVMVISIIGIIWSISNIKTLPPTDLQGHVEENPISHVLKEPMPISIQKHMLEHADGTGRAGVVINYNCEDYSCEPSLIVNLEAFAGRYDYVYVAPFKNMDVKIALTKLNRIETLNFYDEAGIDSFINGF